MGVLLPQNLKKNPMNVMGIRCALVICTHDNGTSWPHGDTSIIFRGIKPAMAPNRNIPKKPSKAANFSLNSSGDCGLLNTRGGRQSSNRKACLVSGADGKILRMPRATLAVNGDNKYFSGQPAWRHMVRTCVRYAVTVDPLLIEGVNAK